MFTKNCQNTLKGDIKSKVHTVNNVVFDVTISTITT